MGTHTRTYTKAQTQTDTRIYTLFENDFFQKIEKRESFKDFLEKNGLNRGIFLLYDILDNT